MHFKHVSQMVLLAILPMAFSVVGCQRAAVELPPKAPRPVTTIELHCTTPAAEFEVSGSVQSWKTEQIAFEVHGRLLRVNEPGENIIGEVFDSTDESTDKRTPLAYIDPSRYEVAVASAQAGLEVAELEMDVVNIRINHSIPAQKESAQADVKLAEDEFERVQGLKDQNAI